MTSTTHDPPLVPPAGGASPVALLTRLEAKDAVAARELASRLAELDESVPSEPGNLSYTVMAVEDDPLVFFITESWATRANAAQHAERVAASDTAERVASLLAGPIDTRNLKPLQAANSGNEGDTQ